MIASAAPEGTWSGSRYLLRDKANLTREQLKLYIEAGVRRIQPGVESLSTPVLARMRKGTTALQNIQLLKWCRELGLTPIWNHLTGFPGERPEDYAGIAALARKLFHLMPPNGLARVRFDRFSPYMTESDLHGVKNLRPSRLQNTSIEMPVNVICMIWPITLWASSSVRTE